MMTLTVKRFCLLIRRERRDQGRTLGELSEQAGITLTNLNRLELRHTKRGPTLETAIRLLEALGYEMVAVKKNNNRRDSSPHP